MNQKNNNVSRLNGIPTKEELHRRINNQLVWRGPTDTVALIWHGYLAALLEWGAIDVNLFNELSDLLPEVGNKELYELFLDEPNPAEKDQEIEEYLRSKKIEK